MAAEYFAEVAKKMLRIAGPALELSKAYKEIAGLLAKVSDKVMEPDEKGLHPRGTQGQRTRRHRQGREAAGRGLTARLGHVLTSGGWGG
jgi:hypothetical protein